MVPNLGEETVALFKSKEAGLGLSSFFDKASDLDRRSWHSIVRSNRRKGSKPRASFGMDCIGQNGSYLWGPERKSFWLNQQEMNPRRCLLFQLCKLQAKQWKSGKHKVPSFEKNFNWKKKQIGQKATSSRSLAVPLAFSPLLDRRPWFLMLLLCKRGLFGSGSRSGPLELSSTWCRSSCAAEFCIQNSNHPHSHGIDRHLHKEIKACKVGLIPERSRRRSSRGRGLRRRKSSGQRSQKPKKRRDWTPVCIWPSLGWRLGLLNRISAPALSISLLACSH